ncbi:MAG: IS481 family transposase [Candidatus Dormiibacter spiritus]|nr:MAG: IS481 family transposase [Candidatus Dormibacteraeota bacterium]
MSRGRYLVDAVLLEGRSPSELARQHGLARSWIYQLLARFREGGYEALEPRSRRPRSCSHQVDAETEATILRLRDGLQSAGYDAGAQTIAHHLIPLVPKVPAVATIWRILSRRGLVTPQPHKRPRSSFVRFQADFPNQLWQADITLWHLANGKEVEILNCLDDHSRLLVGSDALLRFKAADVLDCFIAASQAYGLPESLLTDNGAVFTANSRRGKVVLESELERLGVQGKHSTPYHPQTCGKVERFHQTLKKFLAKQPPATSAALLQLQLDSFRAYYNQQRPHRALNGRTPLVAFHARLKAGPRNPVPITNFRVRHDRIDSCGRVTLRYLSRLRHIAVGRAYARQRVTMLVADANVRVLDPDGTLIRELTLDAARVYQPLGQPKVVLDVVRQVSAMS